MRWLIAIVAVLGIVAASLALREHYRTGTSPCSINDRWDCGVVNKSPYAVMGGVPVATIGIVGYILLAALAIARWWRLLVAASLAGLAFSLYLAYIEARVLETWCIFCVISLASISLIALLALGTFLAGLFRRPAKAV